MIGENGPATPTELPRAVLVSKPLAHPPLGLVLVLGALMVLPQSLHMFLQFVLLDRAEPPLSLTIVFALQVAVHVLQLATGIAIIKRWQAAVVCALYLASSLALVIGMGWLMRDEVNGRQIFALAIESLGGPALVLIATAVVGVERLVASRAIGGILLVQAISIFAGDVLHVVQELTFIKGATVSAGFWVSFFLRLGYTLGVGVLGLLAGLRLANGRPARTLLGAYVIVAIAGSVLMNGGSIIYMLIDGGRFTSWVIASNVIALVLALTKALVIWWYAQPELDGASHRVDGALPWIALWFVPYLLARCLLFDEITQLVGSNLGVLSILLCGALAVTLVIAAGTSLRDEASLGWWIASAVLALGLIGLVMKVLLSLDKFMTRGVPYGHVALLFAVPAAAAWLRRRVTSAR